MLRDHLYAWAGIAIGVYRNSDSRVIPGIADLPESDRLAVEERAAIQEFDGNLTRAQAEKLALHSYLQSQLRH